MSLGSAKIILHDGFNRANILITQSKIKKKRDDSLRLHPSPSHSLAPFSLWYHIVVSRSN